MTFRHILINMRFLSVLKCIGKVGSWLFKFSGASLEFISTEISFKVMRWDEVT